MAVVWLSFSGFGVLMSTPNPEKDSLLGQTIPIQKPFSIFEITGFFSPTLYIVRNVRFINWMNIEQGKTRLTCLLIVIRFPLEVVAINFSASVQRNPLYGEVNHRPTKTLPTLHLEPGPQPHSQNQAPET